MKLRNKKTGEINYGDLHLDDFDSLSELCKEWEDYEEPKKYYYINDIGAVQIEDVGKFDIDELARKEIGNHFETEEEAEKAAKKLEAWKRLKDKGFKFDDYDEDFEGLWVIYPNDTKGTWCLAEDKADLDLLFGGEE